MKPIRTFAFGLAALAALVAAPADAADLPVKARPMVPKVFDWTGCYVGVHLGGGWQASSYVTRIAASGAGVLGGGQAGCNYQIRQFVVGVEAEVWSSTLYDRTGFSSATSVQDAQSRNLWDAGVSVRAGWAIDNALIYGKLGVVWSEFDYSRSNAFTGFAFTQRGSATAPGLVVGLGFEYALAPNWTAKFEYNYINYGGLTVDFTDVNCDPGCTTTTFSETIKEAKQIAKVGLNYKFGDGGGPLSAMAAAIPFKGPAMPRVFDWTGCYVGVHAGGGVQTSNFADSLHGFGGLGAVGGGQAGCNYQWKRFVVGLEGEVWASSIQDEDVFRDVDTDRRETSRNRWDGAISVRAGVAFDRALVYGKLGGVWGRFDYEDVTVQPARVITQSGGATLAGVLIGAGFEYALTDNWTAKFEYNYIDYGNKLVNFSVVDCNPLCAPTDSFSLSVKEVKQIAKVGLNYKFAGVGYPVPASVLTAAMPTKGPAPLPRMFDWSGCYVGAHVGGGWQASTQAGSNQSGVGVLGGGQAGCNYQWRRFVIGIEGEVWASSLHDRDESVFGTFSSERESRNRWDSAVSVRSGIAIEDAFIYGKLGVAWGKFDYSSTSVSGATTVTGQGSATFTGLLLGIGFEYALSGNWTAKFEYNYIDFGNRVVDVAFSQCTGGICTAFAESSTVKEIKQIAKVGLNYKFGNPAASGAMAAYASAAPVAVNWTGCYVGAHAGGGWQSSSFTTFAGPFGGIGPLGGAQVGCNYQWQQFVIGLEGEFWGSGLEDRNSSVFSSGFSVTQTSRNRWDGAISARVGYAIERTFLYGKLGGVWGRFDYEGRFVDGGDSETTNGSATFAGVLIGAGFEYALAGSWTAKFEYNYIDYGETLVPFTEVDCIAGTCVTSAFNATVKERKQLAKLGLNYRFGAR